MRKRDEISTIGQLVLVSLTVAIGQAQHPLSLEVVSVKIASQPPSVGILGPGVVRETLAHRIPHESIMNGAR